MKTQETFQEQNILQGEINAEFIDWLGRSLVCTSEEPRDLGSLASTIRSGFGYCTKICSLSNFKFIPRFPTMEQMEDVFQNHDELGQWFINVKKWNKYDCCETRSVWLEILGVPPHGWSWENCLKITELWGRLVCLGKPIFRTNSFQSMKVLIVTDIFHTIQGCLIF